MTASVECRESSLPCVSGPCVFRGRCVGDPEHVCPHCGKPLVEDYPTLRCRSCGPIVSIDEAAAAELPDFVFPDGTTVFFKTAANTPPAQMTIDDYPELWGKSDPDYNCGSNYCDDPACVSNQPEHPSHHPHPEVL